jgi:hypothetical protein
MAHVREYNPNARTEDLCEEFLYCDRCRCWVLWEQDLHPHGGQEICTRCEVLLKNEADHVAHEFNAEAMIA